MMKIKSLKFIFPVIFLSYIFGQFASDLYLPSLPVIATSLSGTISQIQFSVSAFMLGFACSRLIYGPLSDGVGRKGPLLIGLVLCALGSVMCSIATGMDFFLLGRLIQGAGSWFRSNFGRSDYPGFDRRRRAGQVLFIFYVD